MIKGLEEKRVSFMLKDKTKSADVGKYSALNEEFAAKLRQIMNEMKTKDSLLTNLEIELGNQKESRALETISSVRKKILKSQVHIMSAINTLI